MPPSRVSKPHDNSLDDSSLKKTSRPRAHHRCHTKVRHHYDSLHPRGLHHQQAVAPVLPGVHLHDVASLPVGAQPPPWSRPLPTPPRGSTSEAPTYFNTETCSCQYHHRGHDLPPCYTCCEKAREGRSLSCSGESLWTLPYTSPVESAWSLPYTSPYTTCHSVKSSGNSTLDVRLPRTSPCVKFKITKQKPNKTLDTSILHDKLMSILSPKGLHKSTENTEEKTFWWLADLEDNLAWGVFVFHLGVIPLLLVHSGRAVYWFILPIFVFFCGWIVVRKCGRGVHPCQILAKLALSSSCLMLAITVCELMDNLPQVSSAIFVLIIIIILVALPTGYLICKKDEISC